MRNVVVCLALGAVLGAPRALAAQDREIQNLYLVGYTSSGTYFERNCPRGHVLTGFRWRSGYLLDAIGIKCSQVYDNGTLGRPANVGTMAGGNGGTAGSDNCRGGVIAEQVGVAQVPAGIGNYTVWCYRWYAASRSWGGQFYSMSPVARNVLPALRHDTCSYGTKPAIGIRGRHGMFIDAVGIRCGLP